MPNAITRWKIRQPGCSFGSVSLLLPIKVTRVMLIEARGNPRPISDSPEHSNIIVVSMAIL